MKAFSFSMVVIGVPLSVVAALCGDIRFFAANVAVAAVGAVLR